MATSVEIQERIKLYARALREELGGVDESMGVCWLDAIENQAVEIGDAFTRELAQQQSQGRLAPDESTCPGCGKQGRYRGHRQRELIGRRGPISLAEPEYSCPCCRKSFFPAGQRDRR